MISLIRTGLGWVSGWDSGWDCARGIFPWRCWRRRRGGARGGRPAPPRGRRSRRFKFFKRLVRIKKNLQIGNRHGDRDRARRARYRRLRLRLQQKHAPSPAHPAPELLLRSAQISDCCCSLFPIPPLHSPHAPPRICEQPEESANYSIRLRLSSPPLHLFVSFLSIFSSQRVG